MGFGPGLGLLHALAHGRGGIIEDSQMKMGSVAPGMTDDAWLGGASGKKGSDPRLVIFHVFGIFAQ